jgi:hypothetical protein
MRSARNIAFAWLVVAVLLVESRAVSGNAMTGFIDFANSYQCTFLPYVEPFDPPSWWTGECDGGNPECDNENPYFCADFDGVCEDYSSTFYGTQMQGDACNELACEIACTCEPKPQ